MDPLTPCCILPASNRHLVQTKPTELTHLYISFITNHGTEKTPIDNARWISRHQKQRWGRAIAPFCQVWKFSLQNQSLAQFAAFFQGAVNIFVIYAFFTFFSFENNNNKGQPRAERIYLTLAKENCHCPFPAASILVKTYSRKIFELKRQNLNCLRFLTAHLFWATQDNVLH